MLNSVTAVVVVCISARQCLLQLHFRCWSIMIMIILWWFLLHNRKGIQPVKSTYSRYSRPIILVVLAQWQHLMMSFIHCFAQKSKICHKIDTNRTIKKTLNLAPQNSPKYAILRSQNKKIVPSQTPSRWGVSPHPTHFGTSSPLTLNSRWPHWLWY